MDLTTIFCHYYYSSFSLLFVHVQTHFEPPPWLTCIELNENKISWFESIIESKWVSWIIFQHTWFVLHCKFESFTFHSLNSRFQCPYSWLVFRTSKAKEEPSVYQESSLHYLESLDWFGALSFSNSRKLFTFWPLEFCWHLSWVVEILLEILNWNTFWFLKVTVPPWPIYRRKPLNWQKPKNTDGAETSKKNKK